jgi:alpha-tubulin suppressor-like RCC1 family protein
LLGDNNSFQLGIGESTNSSDCVLDEFFMGYCFNPIKVSQIEGLWSKVTTGGRSTCGVSNNKLYCWGNNQYGQLGLCIGISESKLPTLVTIP